jgi:hypothetical protein
MESELLIATLLPDWGSKLVSLIYKPLDKELLWQNPVETYRRTTYADSYERGEASGFDEMFPTISRCYYERAPWSGVEMPDHGEVWSIPWESKIGETVDFRVDGIRFPYVLEKRVSLERGTITVKYHVQNRSHFDMDYIWAAHPLFNAVWGMKILVPEGMTSIVNSVPGGRLGPYGRMYGFPHADLEDGTTFDLSMVPSMNSTGYQKYWFLDRAPEGWCILHNPEARINIGLTWPCDAVPYLGVWVNEGGWEHQYNVAPEPATGAMDRVDFSGMWGMNSVLPAGTSRQWWLAITASEGDEPQSGPLEG